MTASACDNAAQQIDHLKEMEDMYYKLKERFKHNPTKQYQVAEDWFDYLNSKRQVQLSFDLLDAAGDYDHYEDSTKEDRMRVEEIEKRFSAATY
jgi:hypothetical protein